VLSSLSTSAVPNDPVPIGGPRPAAYLAVALFTAVAVRLALIPGLMPDFFIYRAGAGLVLRGENPYDLSTIRALVAAEFSEGNPSPEGLVNNCGYFLPPLAAVLFSPLAVLPLGIAKVVWALLNGLAALAIVRLPNRLRRRGDPLPGPGMLHALVPFLLLLNFVMIAVVRSGQTSIIAVGCVAAGLNWIRIGGWRSFVSTLAWSVAFIKPHVGLPLIPLAWYLGGWKRAATLVAIVAALNAIAATRAGGSPLFLREYFNFLSSSHQAVLFNHAELNCEMTSWNRLLYVATKPFAGDRFLIEQTAPITIASYVTWFALVVARCGLARIRPSAAWVTATAGVAAAICPQVLAYEAVMLLLVIPWVRELFAERRYVWAWLAIVLLAAQAISLQTMERIGVDFHRPLAAGLLALIVLLRPTVDPPPSV
jgi:hypothetical protein